MGGGLPRSWLARFFGQVPQEFCRHVFDGGVRDAYLHEEIVDNEQLAVLEIPEVFPDERRCQAFHVATRDRFAIAILRVEPMHLGVVGEPVEKVP